MTKKIRVTILEDHQSIIDGYLFRLSKIPEIEVVSTLLFGDDLEPTLEKIPTDVLLLDVNVPTSADNRNPYPILYLIPKLLDLYPKLALLVISMYAERSLICAIMEAGASGYVFKGRPGCDSGTGQCGRFNCKWGCSLQPKGTPTFSKESNPKKY